jgi:hypothetical protein
MYVTLICFFITAFVFVAFGRGLVYYVARRSGDTYSFFDHFFLGLCTVGTFLNCWSLFLPTNYVALIVLITASLLFTYKTGVFTGNTISLLKKRKLFVFFGFLAISLTLLFALTVPKLFDSYLYHINSILFNENYAAIPGLANLHDRYGFNSSSFVLNAAFSFSALYNQSLYLISALSFAFFVWWILHLTVGKKGIVGIFMLIFLYYFTIQYQQDISSPGSDLVTNILVSYLCISLIISPDGLKKKPLLFLILPLFCITLKISLLPVVLLSIVAVNFSRKQIWQPALTFIYFSAAFVLPWIIKNIILSGYLIFPMEQLDFFTFDWKVPADVVAETKCYVYSWARIPYKPCQEVLNLSLSEWWPVWWEAQQQKQKVFFILAIISPVTYLIYWMIARKKAFSSWFIMGAAAYACFMLWAASAPDFRFAYSVILLLACAPFFMIVSAFVTKPVKPLVYLSLSVTMLLLFIQGKDFLMQEYAGKQFKDYVYLPPDAYYLKYNYRINYNTIELKNNAGKSTDIFVPVKEYSQCYDQFPCTPHLSPDVKLRGEDISDGFYR